MTQCDRSEPDGALVPLTRSVVERVRAASPRRVLICEPQLRSYGLPYLPAMWGVLKTYWETHGAGADLVDWLPPVHRMDQPDEIVDALGDETIDVLGLSCYTWNWRLQREIARRVRATRPDCLIIAGGPHPDYRDPHFFDANPFIDAVVVKEGEIPFNAILRRTLAYPTMRAFAGAGRPMIDIPGLCLPGRGGALTAPAESPGDHRVSHYLAQRPYYEQFMRDHPQGVVAAWETSRGCPFKCSYCDWGSATMSKVRRFDMERLHAEIDWFARSGVNVIFSVDSNFGMFPTDVDLTDAIIHAKETHGAPSYFVWSNAKNVPGRTVEITRKVVAAGLDTAHTLSIQHSSPEVLEATDRRNISIDKQIQVVRELQADGVPISAQLILGLPGDTPALWRQTFMDLMEWGIHDGCIVTNYHLLPNAPAASAAYRSRWAIETIDRFIYDGPGVRADGPVDPLTEARGDIIVATSTFSRDEWVRMSVDASIIRALHNGGVTQSVARYLRCTHDVPYARFYAGVLDELLLMCAATAHILPDLAACFEGFLRDETPFAMLPMPGAPDASEHVEPHRWAFGELCRAADPFIDELTLMLRRRFPHVERLDDLCAYQRSILVRPDYDPDRGRCVPIRCDWPAYFAQPETVIPGDPAPEPRETRGGVLMIDDRSWDDRSGRGAYDWPPGDTPDAWRRWFHAIATGRMSAARCNHAGARVADAAATARRITA